LLLGEPAAGALQAVDVAAVVLIGLLVVPPLAISVLLVVGPLLVMTLVLGLFAAVLSRPYLLLQHFRGHYRDHWLERTNWRERRPPTCLTRTHAVRVSPSRGVDTAPGEAH
jgi:hypothetical protein